jgi:hypothetical protein
MPKKEKLSKGKADKMSASSSKPAKGAAVAAKPAAAPKKASGKR